MRLAKTIGARTNAFLIQWLGRIDSISAHSAPPCWSPPPEPAVDLSWSDVLMDSRFILRRGMGVSPLSFLCGVANPTLPRTPRFASHARAKPGRSTHSISAASAIGID